VTRRDGIVIAADQVDRRIVAPSAFVADPSAFVDVRIPRSVGKASYSFIGAGVSQNHDNPINLPEPHGFHIGAASMPSGVVNNQHMHFTAEVFICTRGAFMMRIGELEDQEVEIREGDVFSVPTWIFRGFQNVSGDDAWLFTVLGHDDTGGILWSPRVIKEAAETGMYLRHDQTILDTNNGDTLDGQRIIGPLSEVDLEELDAYTDEEIRAHIVNRDTAAYSERALLSSLLEGHATELAPVIGYGMTEDRHQVPPMHRPLGFTLEWLRVAPGNRIGTHRHDDTQAVLLIDGDWEVSFNRDEELTTRRPDRESIVSFPAGVWRDLANVGDRVAHALVVNGGDGRTRLEWDERIVAAVRERGFARDAHGYLAPLRLVEPA
jgi:quercetin dioxygenase-like cupin family protein